MGHENVVCPGSHTHEMKLSWRYLEDARTLWVRLVRIANPSGRCRLFGPAF